MLGVTVPNPGAPDSGDVIERGGEFGSWLAERPETFWTLVVIAVLALVITTLLKRPFVRGLVVGAILLGIIALALL